MSDEVKAAISAESKAQARQMAAEAMTVRLKEISMGVRDFSLYAKYKAKVCICVCICVCTSA